MINDHHLVRFLQPQTEVVQPLFFGSISPHFFNHLSWSLFDHLPKLSRGHWRRAREHGPGKKLWPTNDQDIFLGKSSIDAGFSSKPCLIVSTVSGYIWLYLVGGSKTFQNQNLGWMRVEKSPIVSFMLKMFKGQAEACALVDVGVMVPVVMILVMVIYQIIWEFVRIDSTIMWSGIINHIINYQSDEWPIPIYVSLSGLNSSALNHQGVLGPHSSCFLRRHSIDLRNTCLFHIGQNFRDGAFFFDFLWGSRKTIMIIM